MCGPSEWGIRVRSYPIPSARWGMHKHRQGSPVRQRYVVQPGYPSLNAPSPDAGKVIHLWNSVHGSYYRIGRAGNLIRDEHTT